MSRLVGCHAAVYKMRLQGVRFRQCNEWQDEMIKRIIVGLGLGVSVLLMNGCADTNQPQQMAAAQQTDNVPAEARESLRDYYYYVGTHRALAKKVPYSDSQAFGQCSADMLEDLMSPHTFMVLKRSVQDPSRMRTDPEYKDAFAQVDTSRPDVQDQIKKTAQGDCPDVYNRHPDLFMEQILPPPQS